MSLAAFGMRRPIAATIVKFVLLFGGVTFGVGLQREFFPSVDPTMVVIGAPYPGASPEEIERSLAIKIEDQLADLRNVKEVQTTVTEGATAIRVEFRDRVDIDVAIADVKREVDALQNLPPQSERIVVTKLEPNIPVIQLSLSGDADERALKEEIRRIRDDLRSLPGMGDLILGGVRRDEVSVEVRPEALVEHGLSIDRVAARIGEAMRELPGGAVRGPTATVAIRTMTAGERAEEVRRIVVKAGAGGQMLRVGDIAEVREGFVDADVMTRLNGRPCATMTVFKVGDQDAVEISDMVKAYAAGRMGGAFVPRPWERLALMNPEAGAVSARHRAYLLGASHAAPPPGEVSLTTDLARFIEQRLALLSRNALWGGIGVFVVLMLLLNWRAALWVLVGLAAAILGTLVVMRLAGITLNLLTMFGLIIVLGMLVDDGIVVAENIISRHDGGEPALEAAVRGTDVIAWPVVATVVTTIFAFVPLMLIKGRIGDLLGALPLVVLCALAVSLLECLFCLPVHMGHTLRREDEAEASGGRSLLSRVEARFDRARDAAIDKYVRRPYARLLRACLGAPLLTLVCFVAALVVSLGMVAGGRQPFSFFQNADSETIIANLRMPIGTPVSRTDELLRRLEDAARAQPEVLSVFAVVGSQADLEGGAESTQSHLGQLFIELRDVESRQAAGGRTSDEVIVAMRREAGALPGIKSLTIEAIGAGPGGPAITLTVTGEDAAMCAPAVERVKQLLSEFDGVYDVSDDFDTGQRELRLSLRPGASDLGFTAESIGRQVRGAVYGLEAHTFAGDGEDVDVRVRYPEGVRRSLAAIERMHVVTPEGLSVPLAEVVEISEADGFATVRRLDRKRAITVTASVDAARANTEEVMRGVRPRLASIEASMPGVRVLERGRQKDMADSFSTLPIGLLVAVTLNFVVLCVLFGSYMQPVLIMLAVPFSMIGMIWGHYVMGYHLTILSLIGFVALSGVVVNGAIVFMEFFNQGRAAGLSTRDAAYEAGRARLRAILLTTITTVVGLAPLLLERSFQARVLIPMAITICGGLISATALVLLALPCLLVLAERVRSVLGMLWTGRVPPAPGDAQGVATSSV